MDKQPYDHIENMIRNAADHIVPPDKEEAWNRMELLLDKELRKKRRLVFIWWWTALLLCIVSGIGFYYFHNYKNAGPAVVQYPELASGPKRLRSHNRKPTHQQPDAIAAGRHPINQQPIPVKTPDRPVTDNMLMPGIPGMPATMPVSTTAFKRRPGRYPSTGSAPTHGYAARPASSVNKNNLRHKPAAEDNQTAITGATTLDKPVSTPDVTQKDMAQKISASPATASNAVTDTTVATARQVKTPVLNKPADKSRGVYVVGSLAPNGTNLRGFSISNLGYVSGGGIGYRFNNRWSVQSGLYAGRKIYNAGPNDYHVKKGALSYVRLKSVNANCYILDIPLSVRYDMIHKSRFSGYGTTGLSSVIMKKERYKYHFNDALGRYGSLDSMYTGNADLLSALNFSVGFEHKIINGLYLQAEPYIKIPVAGIGEGNVKLYNTGLHVGLRYQPGRKRKTH